MRFINCTIYDEHFRPVRRDLVVRDGRIVDLPLPDRPSAEHMEGGELVDLGGRSVIPGLIDIHIHGAVAADTMDADFDGLNRISHYLARVGVTGFLPTTMTVAVEDIEAAFRQSTAVGGAQILGFNMEGPFLNVARKGAHVAEHIRPATLEEFERYQPERGIRVLTIAPEMPGALDFIEAVADRVVCSIGHSAADYDTALAAIDRGARSLTHTFNAMPPLLHRDPGLIAAAVRRGIHAEIIADTIHVHPAMIYCAWKLFGRERLTLISDSMRAGGLEDGEYELGGQAIFVREGVARTADGTIGGGTSTVWAGLRNAVAAGIPYGDALRMASLTPAELIGVADRKGSIAVGRDADFVVLDGSDKIHSVYLAGERYAG